MDGPRPQAGRAGAPGWALGLALVATAGCSAPVAELAAWLEAGRDHPAAPLLVIAVFLASGFVAAPLSAVMVPTMVLFGPLEGSAWTFLGATASAALFFKLGAGGSALGRRLGAGIPADGRLARLLASDGILAVAAARNLPLAPYPVVNLALGALPLRFADFMIGNTIGLAPWVLLYALTGARLRALVVAPSVAGAAWAALAVAAVAGTSLGAARLATRFLGRERRTLGAPPS
jgi:uncharacterized membrane protein YdjX (TVP38/TMEM64 family)